MFRVTNCGITEAELFTESNIEPQDTKCSLKQFNIVALSDIEPDGVVMHGGSSFRILPAAAAPLTGLAYVLQRLQHFQQSRVNGHVK